MNFTMPKLTHDGQAGLSRKPLDNRDVQEWLMTREYFTHNNLPEWLDACLTGATGQLTGFRVRPSRILGLLLALDTISPATVAQVMNRKRVALGDRPYTDRYCRMVAAACRCASQAIAYHSRNNPAPIEEAPRFEGVKPLPYSDDEMRELKRLSLHAPFATLQAYEQELKAKYNTI